ncbi:MAG TPA: YihY/virulence factor BrkB family protein [Polyangiaceae bacterium]|nr:YihY/virulence factor BrkB family protein [Polyangiaceae bacterium]
MAHSSVPEEHGIRAAWSLVKATGNDFMDDNALRLAAALAYYSLLSLAPLVVLAIAIAGFAVDEHAVRGAIAHELGTVVGSAGAVAVEGIVRSAKAPTAGIVSSVVGLVVLLFGASGVFGELQSALDTIWEVAPKPGRGLKGIVKDRLFSFAMVMGVAFLLLVSLILSAALAAVGRYFGATLPGGEAVWHVVNFVISLGVVAALFAVMFKTVPDAKVDWHDVWVGGLVTSLLFGIGKFLIALYLGKSSTSSAYGAAGSLVLLVIWVYYSASILLLGAEFTRVYASRFGKRIEPSENAERVSRGRPSAAPSR